jgi:hypothetical protein
MAYDPFCRETAMRKQAKKSLENVAIFLITSSLSYSTHLNQLLPVIKILNVFQLNPYV